jgi:tRNA1Val (adenine37-N6)-methyltransferase
MELNKFERIDDLQLNNLKIIQNTKSFCYGIDAVLLSNYIKSKLKYNILEIGTGTGIIPLLLSAKIKFKHIDAIEIQENIVEMAKRSIKMNDLEEKISILNFDIKEYKAKVKPAHYNIVLTNPPYTKMGTGKTNPNETFAISRHEMSCSLDDILKASYHALQSNGSLYMIHRADRLTDIICEMRKYNIEPKNIRYIYPKINKPPNLILIKGIKGGKSDLKHESPLIIYNDDGTYTKEIKTIYGLVDS